MNYNNCIYKDLISYIQNKYINKETIKADRYIGVL